MSAQRLLVASALCADEPSIRPPSHRLDATHVASALCAETAVILLVLLLCLTAFAQPLPPGAARVASVIVQPPATNPPTKLPFDLLYRVSNGWTLLTIITRTNLSRLYFVMSTNADFAVTNAEMPVTFDTNWPATNHVPGFNLNDGASPFGPPPHMFYRVYQMQ